MKVLKHGNTIIKTFTPESSNEAICEFLTKLLRDGDDLGLNLSEAHSCEASVNGDTIEISGDEDSCTLDFEGLEPLHLPMTNAEVLNLALKGLDALADRATLKEFEEEIAEAKELLKKIIK